MSLPEVSPKSYAVAVCLSAVFGVLGIQHFYLGRWTEAVIDLAMSIAVLYLILSGQFLWALLVGAVDVVHTFLATILLITGSLRDGHGRLVCYPGQRLRSGEQP